MLVQYRAACFVWGDHGEDNIVSDMLKQLDWPTLEESWEYDRLIPVHYPTSRESQSSLYIT